MLAFSLIFKIISCCVMPNHHLKKMIEQTELVVSKWEYNPPLNFIETGELSSSISFEVMKKRTAEKKKLPAGLPANLFLKRKKYWNMWQEILM